MAEIANPPGLSAEDLLARYRAISGNVSATLDDMFGVVMTAKAVYVANDVMTVASLLAAYPASAATLGKYARVSDLYGSVDEIMRCRYDGANYRWVPQRESFSGNNAAASGAVTIMPLVTPPVLDLTGTLIGNLTPTLSNANAYIGQQQVIRSRGALGVFGISVAGLIGGGTAPLLTGADRTFIYTSNGWRA